MGFEDLDTLMDAEVPTATQDKAKPRHKKPRVMVVDDDPHLLDAMKALLEDRYDLLLCKSGEKALANVDSSIHAVLLDIKMSGLNGFEVFRSIKSKFNHLPIIFHTAHQDAFDPYDVMNKLRPYGYLQKGQDEGRLLAVLARAVRYRMKFLQSEIKLAELVDQRKHLEDEIKNRNHKIESLKKKLPDSTTGKRISASATPETGSEDEECHESPSLLGLGEVLIALKRALATAAQTRDFLSFAVLEINDLEYIRQKVGPNNLSALVDMIAEALGELTEDSTGRMGNAKLALIMRSRNESSACEQVSSVQNRLAQMPFPFTEQQNISYVSITTSAAIITVQEKTPPEARSMIFAAEKELARTRRPTTNTCSATQLDTDR